MTRGQRADYGRITCWSRFCWPRVSHVSSSTLNWVYACLCRANLRPSKTKFSTYHARNILGDITLLDIDGCVIIKVEIL